MKYVEYTISVRTVLADCYNLETKSVERVAVELPVNRGKQGDAEAAARSWLSANWPALRLLEIVGTETGTKKYQMPVDEFVKLAKQI